MPWHAVPVSYTDGNFLVLGVNHLPNGVTLVSNSNNTAQVNFTDNQNRAWAISFAPDADGLHADAVFNVTGIGTWSAKFAYAAYAPTFVSGQASADVSAGTVAAVAGAVSGVAAGVAGVSALIPGGQGVAVVAAAVSGVAAAVGGVAGLIAYVQAQKTKPMPK